MDLTSVTVIRRSREGLMEFPYVGHVGSARLPERRGRSERLRATGQLGTDRCSSRNGAACICRFVLCTSEFFIVRMKARVANDYPLLLPVGFSVFRNLGLVLIVQCDGDQFSQEAGAPCAVMTFPIDFSRQ